MLVRSCYQFLCVNELVGELGPIYRSGRVQVGNLPSHEHRNLISGAKLTKEGKKPGSRRHQFLGVLGRLQVI